jgi:hypothetical protein
MHEFKTFWKNGGRETKDTQNTKICKLINKHENICVTVDYKDVNVGHGQKL